MRVVLFVTCLAATLQPSVGKATVTLLEAPRLEPGHSALVQLKLDRELLLLPGDPFVLRGRTPLPPLRPIHGTHEIRREGAGEHARAKQKRQARP